MKKVVVLLSCSLLSLSMMAGDVAAKHYIEFSVGDIFANDAFLVPYYNTGEREAYRSWQYARRAATVPIGLYYLVPEKAVYLPSFTLSYYCQALPWLQVGAEASTSNSFETWRRKGPGQVPYYLRTNLNLAAAVRFNYYHRNITDLYSGLALGTSIRMHSSESQAITSSAAWVAWNITALGVRFGKQVYGNVEIGYGYKGFFSAGVGVRL